MALWRITNTFFTGLINRLGIRPPPQDGFAFSDTVLPVSIVDADISLGAVATTPLFDVGQVFTAGESIAPAANTRLATTGAQVAGNYTALFIISHNELPTTGRNFRVRRRNAADTADVWSQLWIVSNPGQNAFFSLRFTLSTNELVVIENVQAGNPGIAYQGIIILTPS